MIFYFVLNIIFEFVFERNISIALAFKNFEDGEFFFPRNLSDFPKRR